MIRPFGLISQHRRRPSALGLCHGLGLRAVRRRRIRCRAFIMETTAEGGVRVLWLAHRDLENPRAGGAERTIYEVGRRLASRGHEVVLITAGWRGSRPRTVLDGIEVRRCPGNLGVHLALPLVLVREEFDAAICDLGHAVPWPSIPLFMRGRCAVFFRHLHARTLGDR